MVWAMKESGITKVETVESNVNAGPHPTVPSTSDQHGGIVMFDEDSAEQKRWIT